ncbi:MAG: hypothetical protein Q8O72_10695 [Bacteroidales bacterium]|nr:hypothetical protein [Bacteroidales bacterium]
MSLKTLNVNYNISGGDHVFEAIQLDNDNLAISVIYTGINSTDAELRLEQSVDGINFNEVPGSNQTINNAKPSHMFNILAKRGLFIRLVLIIHSATAGLINKINALT